jgi:FAD/FMN-containing dehydrogenase
MKCNVDSVPANGAVERPCAAVRIHPSVFRAALRRVDAADSEGRLGVIVEIALRLSGIPEAISAATCSFPDMRSAWQSCHSDYPVRPVFPAGLVAGDVRRVEPDAHIEPGHPGAS